jgi:hypothetical protein
VGLLVDRTRSGKRIGCKGQDKGEGENIRERGIERECRLPGYRSDPAPAPGCVIGRAERGCEKTYAKGR